MIKRILVLILIHIFFLVNTHVVLADTKGAGDICTPGIDTCSSPNYSCLQYDAKTYLCLSKILGAGEICDTNNTDTKCVTGFDCQFDNASKTNLCLKSTAASVFGKIKPPPAIAGFLSTLGATDPTGAAGIGKFLSNLIILIYPLAAIVLIFMLLWGAFDWMLSEGNKEKLAAAQNKIISAIIGILLFAVAFAIIAVLGQFTGFTFFVGQK